MDTLKLFDPKFVHFIWDEKLKDKEGFFADDICGLNEVVSDDERNYFGKVIKNGDSEYPFKNVDNHDNFNYYKFFYHDPNYEIKKAFLDNKKVQFKMSDDWIDFTWSYSDLIQTLKVGTECRIKPKSDVPYRLRKALISGKWLQYRNKDGGDWVSFNKHTVCEDFDFDTEHYEYRLKVEEYVPFETLDELIAAWEEKVPGNKNRNKDLTLPIIWFKPNNVPYLKRMITDFNFDDNTVYLSGGDEYDLIHLFNNYRFLDDSIIGKIKE